jgi:hypothetical protein
MRRKDRAAEGERLSPLPPPGSHRLRELAAATTGRYASLAGVAAIVSSLLTPTGSEEKTSAYSAA